MAFNGNLIKAGNEWIPLKYIRLESYKTTPSQRQDLDSYRDANGILHRNVLSHTATKIEFETPYMYGKDMAKFMALLKRNFTSDAERKCNLTYYNEEVDGYKSGEFYMPDAQFTYYNVNESDAMILYAPVRFAFIEY